jgi:hypothetical protein
MNIQMRLITDDNVDQLMSMSYSKNIMELTKNDDMLKEVVKSIETDKDGDKDEINEFIRRYVTYMNRKIKINDFDARKKERAEMNAVNVDESSSFEVVFPETPESESSSSDENMEQQGIAGPTTPDEAPPTNINGPTTPDEAPPTNINGPTTPDEVPPTNINGPRTPSDSPPTTNEPEIDFGTKEYNDFYESLPMKSKKMIMGLPPKDRLWILKKTKLLKDRKMMEEAQQQSEQQEQSEQQQENPEPEKKNLLEYSEEKPVETTDSSSSSSSNGDVNIEIKVDNNDTNSGSSSSNGVKKIVF